MTDEMAFADFVRQRGPALYRYDPATGTIGRFGDNPGGCAAVSIHPLYAMTLRSTVNFPCDQATLMLDRIS